MTTVISCSHYMVWNRAHLSFCSPAKPDPTLVLTCECVISRHPANTAHNGNKRVYFLRSVWAADTQLLSERNTTRNFHTEREHRCSEKLTHFTGSTLSLIVPDWHLPQGICHMWRGGCNLGAFELPQDDTNNTVIYRSRRYRLLCNFSVNSAVRLFSTCSSSH